MEPHRLAVRLRLRRMRAVGVAEPLAGRHLLVVGAGVLLVAVVEQPVAAQGVAPACHHPRVVELVST